MTTKDTAGIILQNKKANFNYEIIETYTAGIVLYGDEVVSLRNHHGSISESYCYIDNGECFITNMYIKSGSSVMFRENDEFRLRKLLLNKKEIKHLKEKSEQERMTIIPLKVIRTNHNFYKVVIGLCKGKKDYDKRNTIKERDIQRDIDRMIK